MAQPRHTFVPSYRDHPNFAVFGQSRGISSSQLYSVWIMNVCKKIQPPGTCVASVVPLRDWPEEALSPDGLGQAVSRGFQGRVLDSAQKPYKTPASVGWLPGYSIP